MANAHHTKALKRPLNTQRKNELLTELLVKTEAMPVAARNEFIEHEAFRWLAGRVFGCRFGSYATAYNKMMSLDGFGPSGVGGLNEIIAAATIRLTLPEYHGVRIVNLSTHDVEVFSKFTGAVASTIELKSVCKSGTASTLMFSASQVDVESAADLVVAVLHHPNARRGQRKLHFLVETGEAIAYLADEARSRQGRGGVIRTDYTLNLKRFADGSAEAPTGATSMSLHRFMTVMRKHFRS